jgi:hypothetical protein
LIAISFAREGNVGAALAAILCGRQWHRVSLDGHGAALSAVSAPDGGDRAYVRASLQLVWRTDVFSGQKHRQQTDQYVIDLLMFTLIVGGALAAKACTATAQLRG